MQSRGRHRFTQMTEDSSDHPRIRQNRQHLHLTPAVVTEKCVQKKYAMQKLRPAVSKMLRSRRAARLRFNFLTGARCTGASEFTSVPRTEELRRTHFNPIHGALRCTPSIPYTMTHSAPPPATRFLASSRARDDRSSHWTPHCVGPGLLPVEVRSVHPSRAILRAQNVQVSARTRRFRP